MFGNFQKLPRSRNKKINDALRLIEKGVSQVKVYDISAKAIPRLDYLHQYGLELLYDSRKKVLVIERRGLFSTWI